MFKVLVLIMVASNTFAQNLPIVSDPDIAENGWYWLPDESGFGLNLDIQPANFVASGYFMFGSIFTYDENGDPIWYTYSGEYKPNPDVYAWREGRGVMATFESPLYISSGGNCPTCSFESSTAEVSDLGSITLTWTDPLHATMTIGNTTKELVYQYFHAGLQGNNADFITEGAWYVQGLLPRTDLIGIRGLVKFDKLVLADTSTWFNEDGNLTFSNDYEWYSSLSTPIVHSSGRFDTVVTDVNGDVFNTRGFWSILLAYDKTTNISFVYLMANDSNVTGVSVCVDSGVQSASGLLKPAVGSNTRLYFSEGVLDNCPTSTLTDDEKRQVFVSLTRIPQGGSDMANLPVFQNRE